MMMKMAMPLDHTFCSKNGNIFNTLKKYFGSNFGPLSSFINKIMLVSFDCEPGVPSKRRVRGLESVCGGVGGNGHP